MVDTTGQLNLRAENVSATVKGFALQEYKFKQFCAISRSNSWSESYYQEGSTELSGGTGSAVRGVPRLANFPYGEPNWTKKTAYLEKYGMEGVVSWEDETTNNIDVVARTLLRIARAVAKAVDDEIWSKISEGQSASQIQSKAVTVPWDSPAASGATVIEDILDCKRLIATQNYNPEGAYLLLNPKNYKAVLTYLYRNGSDAPKLAEGVATNGRVGTVAGLNVVVSPSVTADYAMVIVGQEAATWKEAAPLRVVTIDDPGVKKTIRAWELGVTQLVNPKAVVLISNTDMPA